jgi:APA family basic amino acid/polyamine antiporter
MSKELPKVMGWAGVALYTISWTIGSAIFRVPSDIAIHTGSAGLMTALWLVGSVLALCIAFVFVELAVRFPRSGGTVIYLNKAFGPGTAFVYGWSLLFLAHPASIAAIARTFADYASAFVPMSELSIRLLAASIIGFHTLAALRSTRFAAGLVNFAGVVKIFALILVLLVSFGASPAAPAANPVANPDHFLTGLAFALIGIFFAFDGNVGVTLLTGEVRRPSRDVPLGIVCGTVVISIFYIAISAGYVHVLGISGVQASTAVAADAMKAVLGQRGLLMISALVMGSTFVTTGATILGNSRKTFAMAQDGVFFQRFADVHSQWKTPWLCVLILGGMSMLMVFLGNFGFLVRLYVFVAYPMAALAALGAIVLRRREGLPKEYRMPFYPWPIVAVVGLIALVVGFGAAGDPLTAGYGVVVMLLGTVVYHVWRARRKVKLAASLSAR